MTGLTQMWIEGTPQRHTLRWNEKLNAVYKKYTWDNEKTEDECPGKLVQCWCKKKKKEGSVPGEQQTIPILRTEAWTGLKQVFDTMK